MTNTKTIHQTDKVQLNPLLNFKKLLSHYHVVSKKIALSCFKESAIFRVHFNLWVPYLYAPFS